MHDEIRYAVIFLFLHLYDFIIAWLGFCVHLFLVSDHYMPVFACCLTHFVFLTHMYMTHVALGFLGGFRGLRAFPPLFLSFLAVI
jgi:hypothetical protein